MAESTLSLTYTQVSNALARKLGWPQSTDAARTAAQTTRLGELVDSGYRLFLTPPWQDAGLPIHRWKFLCLDSTIATTAATATTPCPDGFGYLLGPYLYFTDSDTAPANPVQVVDWDVVKAKLQEDDDYQEKPQYVALRPHTTFTAATGQRFQLAWYPIPDAAYTLTFPYTLLADQNSGSSYFRGGMAHTETLKAACRAVAELEMDDTKGVEWANFLSLLRASYAWDVQLSPSNFGLFGDFAQSDQSRARGITHGNVTTTYSP